MVLSQDRPRWQHDEPVRRVDAVLAYNIVRWIRYRAYRQMLRGRLRTNGRGLLGRRSSLQVRPGGSMRIGAGFVTDDDVLIAASGSLTLGDNVFINSGSRLVAHESIEIGSNVVIAANVSILDHDHRTSVEGGRLVIDGDRFVTAPIRIGSNVWLGDKATVLKGVSIGDNVIVGANSVVTKDVASGSVVAGVPARLIRSLDL